MYSVNLKKSFLWCRICANRRLDNIIIVLCDLKKNLHASKCCTGGVPTGRRFSPRDAPLQNTHLSQNSTWNNEIVVVKKYYHQLQAVFFYHRIGLLQKRARVIIEQGGGERRHRDDKESLPPPLFIGFTTQRPPPMTTVNEREREPFAPFFFSTPLAHPPPFPRAQTHERTTFNFRSTYVSFPTRLPHRTNPTRTIMNNQLLRRFSFSLYVRGFSFFSR